MNVSWKRWAAGTAAGAATLLAAAGPAGAAPHEVRVEAVGSATPVTVADLTAAHPESVASTLYCAVRDNTFGCQQGTPGDGLVVSILYFDINFTGSQVVVFNPAYHVGCTSGTTDNEGGANLGAASDQISSVRTYNHCDIKLFDGTNATGTATGWLDESANLGSMSDRASSFKIS
ncbi:hypothetical protein [Amycolatopsis sp. lyj-23]|uniref:hypothetical protein n=1 Tax=Amycolatopsis sp. lyj-23 TaxID=2789283 RepID=UPI0039794B77